MFGSNLANFCFVPGGIIIDRRDQQKSKAPYPIFVTELGIETEVRLLQEAKASCPILVTELGIVTEVRPLHP